MSYALEIPDDVADSVKLPAEELEQELDKELAIALYRRGALSFGKARQLADVSKWRFQEWLQERGVKRHYTEEEFEEDVAYAKHGG